MLGQPPGADPAALSLAEPSPDGPIQRSSSVRERAQRFAPAAPTPSGGPEGAGGGGGRAGPAQLQRGPRSAPSSGIAQNSRGGGRGAEQSPAQPPAGPRPVGSGTGSGSATAAAAAAHDGMKTYFTIEIKDGRVQPLTQSLTPRVVAAPGSQRAGGHRVGMCWGQLGTRWGWWVPGGGTAGSGRRGCRMCREG